MADPTDGRPQRHVESFEDPHYHDEDEPPPVDDTEARPVARPPAKGRPPRRLPSPPRRFDED